MNIVRELRDQSVSTIRILEPHLRSELIDDTAHISWSTGPRAGEQYEVVNTSDCDFSDIPTVEKLEQDMADELRDITITDIDRQLMSSYGTVIHAAVGRAFTRLYSAYYSDEGQKGLEYAQLFDLDGDGVKFNALINDVVTNGRNSDRSRLALRFGIGDMEFSYMNSNVGCSEIINNCFKGDGDKQEYSSMALTHHTLSDATPTIIELGALVADKVRAEAGVARVSGETKGYNASEPEHVFFWPKAKNWGSPDPFGRAVGPGAGLELPAVWGIDDAEPLEDAGLAIESGSWCGEKKVRDGVPLELFTHLWVPPVAVLRHSKLLGDHGYGHIKVSPFPSNVY